MRKVLTFYLVSTLLASCDCLRHAEGHVIDKHTNLPISEVQITNSYDFKKRETNYLVESDETGFFRYSDISGGLFGCPKLTLVFSKSGYKVLESAVKSDTVFLIRD